MTLLHLAMLDQWEGFGPLQGTLRIITLHAHSYRMNLLRG
jgi:hypothetical protein